MLAGNINEHETRVLLSELAASLFARGFSVGSAGNISVRLPDGYPDDANQFEFWARLDPERLSKLDPDFQTCRRRQAIQGSVHASRVLSGAR